MGEAIAAANDTTVTLVASKNKLNEAELANPVLKETAIKVYLFLSGPVPDVESFRKSNGQFRPEVYALIDKWQVAGSIVIRPFLKANGGKLHDEFRDLWTQAFINVRKSAIDAAKLWLQEQFELPAEPTKQAEPTVNIINPQGQATENDEQPNTNRTEQNEPDEQPAENHTPLGSSDRDPSPAVARLQEGEVEDNRRNRRGHRKGTE